jgi:Rod binding domain-containing protein
MDIGNSDNKYVGMNTSMLMEMAHSKSISEKQRNAAVSQQFEAVLVKQFLKEALKPMFKGVFNEDGGAHRMYRHFFTDAISESVAQGGGFGVSNILQQQLNQNINPSSDKDDISGSKEIVSNK